MQEAWLIDIRRRKLDSSRASIGFFTGSSEICLRCMYVQCAKPQDTSACPEPMNLGRFVLVPTNAMYIPVVYTPCRDLHINQLTTLAKEHMGHKL